MFYLKYRPQKISELENEKIKDTLGKALLENHFAHAYLLVGPRGTGKTTVARLLAKVVNCPNRKRGEEPCNKCDSCKAITAGSSLDVIEIDGASNTGVDDIRSLREKVRLAPTSSRYKVYIIDEVHMLSTSAFNALLKTLEEPPAHVIFVLATTEPQKLPETIVSRCLVYDFGKVTPGEIIGSLGRVARGEKLNVDKEVLAVVASRSSGSFRDAQKLLEQLSMQSAKLSLERLDALKSDKIESVARKLLALLAKRQEKESLQLLEDFSLDNGGKIKELTGSLISELGGVLLSRHGIGVQTEDLAISSQEINNLIKKLVEAMTLLRDCPVPQLPLEMVAVEFCGERVSDPLPAVNSGADFWPEVLKKLGEQNHNLVALLRASRPGKIEDDCLTLEVFYKFHKEKLEEKRNKDTIEKTLSDIMGKSLKVRFELTRKAGDKDGNV